MGEYVESVVYRADIDEVKRKLRDLDAATSSAAGGHERSVGRMSRAWDSVKSAVSSAVGLAVRAAPIMGVALLGAGALGLKAAGNFQQTTIAFEGILGSAEKAHAFLEQLRTFAAKTPFELPGLADAAKNLLAVGFNTENVIPVMTRLGNVAATLGVGTTEINGVVRALGQMKGKGKASAEELNQISEQIPGFMAIDAIAKGMGVSVAEAYDQMAKGAVSADDAIGWILDGMERFPGAAGAMERQSMTLNGVLSTFKDTVTNMAIDFLTPYLPALSSAVQSLSGWLEDTGAPAFQSFADGAIDATGRVVSGFRALYSWWTSNGPGIVGVVGTVFGAIAGWVRDVAPAIRSWVRDVLQELGDWWASNGPGIITTVETIGSTMQSLGTQVVRAVQLIVRNWHSIRTPLMIIAGIITTVLIPHWIRLGITAAVSSAKQAVAWAATGAKAVAAAAQHALATYKIIAGWVATGAAAVVSGAQTATVWLMYQAESAKAALAHGAAIAKMVAGWVMMGVQSTLAAAKVAAAWLISIGPAALAIAAVVAVVVAVVKNWDTIKAATAAAWDWVVTKLGQAWTFVKAIVAQGLDFLKFLFLNFTGPGLLIKHWDTIRGGVLAVVTYVKDRFSDMIGFVTGLPARISGAASSMWRGITTAFKSAINALISIWNSFRFPEKSFSIGAGPFKTNFTVGGWSLPQIPYFHQGGRVPGGPQSDVLAMLKGGETVFTQDQMAELGKVLAFALRGSGNGRGDIGQMIVHSTATPKEWLDEGAWRTAG